MQDKETKLLPLSKGFNIYVSKRHIFGTDAVLLANFSRAHKYDKICELGTGCGIIPVLICIKEFYGKIDAVDIQSDAIEMFNRTIELNKLNDKINAVNIDLKLYEEDKGKYDLVICNPPYKVAGGGILNDDEGKTIARHESLCTMEDIIKKANELLKFGGRVCICQKPERLSDVICYMRSMKIEPKILRLVAKRNTTAPWLFLIDGKKGAKPGIVIEKNLIIEDDDGNYSTEVKSYYEDFFNIQDC